MSGLDRLEAMTTIHSHDLDTLAEKLSSLDLTDGEAVALDALLSIGTQTDDDGDDVGGFMLGNKFTGAGLAGSLTGSGLFSTSEAGTEFAGFGAETSV
mgnify:CR=1 FL=1